MKLFESFDLDEFKRDLEPYWKDGQLYIDLDRKDGGDALHRTACYYFALAVLGWHTHDDIENFCNMLDSITMKDGRLYRNETTRLHIRGHRKYHQESNRDQYTPVVATLFLMGGQRATEKAKEIYELLERSHPLWLTGDDINPYLSDHWGFFTRCGYAKMKPWQVSLSDLAHLVGTCLTIWEYKRRKYGSGVILREIKTIIGLRSQHTWMIDFSMWLMRKLLPLEKLNEDYFTGTVNPTPPPDLSPLFNYMLWKLEVERAPRS